VCGDHICEQHVHNLDVINWALKAHPVRAVGMGSRIARRHGAPAEVGNIYDNFSIDFEYPNGVHVLSTCRQLEGGDENVSEALVGTKGMCYPNQYVINKKRILTKEQDKAAVDPYVQEHTDLIESIRTGKPLNELQNVAFSTLTCILGRNSAYTGKPWTWEQALNSKEDTMPSAKLDWNMKLEVAAVPMPGKTKIS
jgi:predicted dehydrogenase